MTKLSVQFQGLLYSATFNEDSTVLDLKNQLEETLGIPVKRQDLIFQDHLLHNESKVVDYQIPRNSQITLLPLQVNEVAISHSEGRTPPLTVKDDTTILHLNTRTETILNIPRQHMGLIHRGSSLEDRKLLRSYEKICDGDDLRLVEKDEITAIGFDGGVYTLLVHGEMTVKHVKQMIQQKHGVPAENIKLRWGGWEKDELEDDFTLAHYGITPQSCVYFHV